MALTKLRFFLVMFIVIYIIGIILLKPSNINYMHIDVTPKIIDNYVSDTPIDFKWNCTVQNHFNNVSKSYLWNAMPKMRHNWDYIGIDGIKLLNETSHRFIFSIHCSSVSHKVIMNFNDNDHIVINAFLMDSRFISFKIGDNIIKFNPLPQSRGYWMVSSPFKYNKTHKISFNYLANGSIAPLIRFNFVPLPSFDASIWSILPYFMDKYQCKRKQDIRFSGLQDWSPCLDQFTLSIDDSFVFKTLRVDRNRASFNSSFSAHVPYSIEDKQCLVYSLGTSRFYYFDLFMGRIGCQVHAFDCTVQYGTKLDSNVYFHPWCVTSEEIIKNAEYIVLKEEFKYKLNLKYDINEFEIVSIIDIIHKLGHENQTINILKVDCEGCEYAVLKDLVAYDDAKYLNNINDLFLELHFFKEATDLYFRSQDDFIHFGDIFWYFKDFKIYDSNLNAGYAPIDPIFNKTYLPDTTCYEYQLSRIY